MYHPNDERINKINGFLKNTTNYLFNNFSEVSLAEQ
jgi:homoserine dehydrogenase